MTRGDTVSLDFAGSLDLLDMIQGVSEHMAKLAGLDDDGIHWVSVAVRESVINAIKHGNGGDTSKRVHVAFEVLAGKDSGLRIKVRDEGCAGFDPSTLPDPLAPENLLKASGRGIFLIRSFMDVLDFETTPEGSTEVVMVKRAAG